METGIMSEQAKKLAQALRSLSTGVDAYRAVADAAAELDRLADLCEVLTAERDTARSATASMLRRRDTVANDLRCQCQALAAERDTMRASIASPSGIFSRSMMALTRSPAKMRINESSRLR